MKKYIEKKILQTEERHLFTPEWYAIFWNPFFITRRELHKAVKKFAREIGTGKNILDVGCGLKPYQKLFQGNDYTGIDVRGGGHKDATKNVTHYFDGTHIPFSDKSFDIVISTQVFEHAQNLSELTDEIRRVLKDEGVLFITMPFVWPEHEIPYDFRRFTSFGHKLFLQEHHFTKITTRPTTGIFGTCGQILSDFFISDFLERKIGRRKYGYKLRFFLTRFLTLFVCFPVQCIFLLLDTLFRKKGLTLDYIVTAKKEMV